MFISKENWHFLLISIETTDISIGIFRWGFLGLSPTNLRTSRIYLLRKFGLIFSNVPVWQVQSIHHLGVCCFFWQSSVWMGMEGLDLVRFWFLWCFWHCGPKPDTMRRIIVKFLKPQPHLPGNATIRQGSTPGWKKLYVYAATQYDFGPQYQQQRINIKTPNGISHSPAKRFRALQFAMHRDGG